MFLNYCAERDHNLNAAARESDTNNTYTSDNFLVDLEIQAAVLNKTFSNAEQRDLNRHFSIYGNEVAAYARYREEIGFCQKKIREDGSLIDQKGFFYTLANLSKLEDCPWRDGFKNTSIDEVKLAVHAREVSPLGALSSCLSLRHIAKTILDLQKDSPDIDLHVKPHGAPMFYFELIKRGRLPSFLLETTGRGGLPLLMMGGIPPFRNTEETPTALADYKLNPENETILVMGDGEMAENKIFSDILEFIEKRGEAHLKIVIDLNGERLSGKCPKEEVQAMRTKLKVLAQIMDVKITECDGHDAEALKRALESKSDTIVIAITIKGHGLDQLPEEGDRHTFVPDPNNLLHLPREKFGDIVLAVKRLSEQTKFTAGFQCLSPDAPYTGIGIGTIDPIDEAATLVKAIDLARNRNPVIVETATPYHLPPWTDKRAYRAKLKDGTEIDVDLKSMSDDTIDRITGVYESSKTDLIRQIGEEKLPIILWGFTYVASFGPPSAHLDIMLDYGIPVIEPRSVEELEDLMLKIKSGEIKGPLMVSISNLETPDAESSLSQTTNKGNAVSIVYEGSETESPIDNVVIAYGTMGVIAEQALGGIEEKLRSRGNKTAFVSISNTNDLTQEALCRALGADSLDSIKTVSFVSICPTKNKSTDKLDTAIKGLFPNLTRYERFGMDGDTRRLETHGKEALCRAGICPQGLAEKFETHSCQS